MKSELWQKIDRLFHAGLERQPQERTTFLNEECAGDPAIRQQVDALLAAHEDAGSFLERPALEVEAQSLAKDESNSPLRSMIEHAIGHYRVISLLGSGGMGEVYLAQDTVLRRQVALKLLPYDFTKDVDRLRRFLQEAHAASALNHPNIITIHEIGVEDNIHFIATEFIKGETLRERMDARPVDIDETLNIATQIAAALDAAHQSGIVHRDIKPDNVMLREDGLVKVLDFGLAKLTETRVDALIDTQATTRAQMRTTPGMVMGTVAYMSPEQARGLTVDARTDIFSFGAVLFEMLTGRSPFAGETTSDIIAAILKAEPDPLSEDTPAGLQPIVRKCLEKIADKRYQTAKELLNDLNRLKHDLDFSADLERSGIPDRARRSVPTRNQGVRRITASAEFVVSQVRLHKRATVAVVGVLALAVAVALLWYRNHTRAAPLTEHDTLVLADFVNNTGDAIFDDSLKQALAFQLEQSPFLNIFSDERVRQVLDFMGHSAGDHVTNDVAREICQRQGLKAYLAGTISTLGSHFVITLEAVNAQTGDTIARQQVEAESKEQVLLALGGAATKLREKLGESLASIQKYDAPVQEVSTSSLEALKAYTIAGELNVKLRYKESITFLERAVELDPNFALAYSYLAGSYALTHQPKLAREAEQKAFDLRARVSEPERLLITASHYEKSDDPEKAIEGYEVLVRTYPHEVETWEKLGFLYLTLGKTERAVERFREAIRLDPNARPFWGVGLALTRLNRFDEAKEVFGQGLKYDDHPFFHLGLYSIAFIQQDAGAMQQQIDWASARSEKFQLIWQGNAAAFSGQLRKAKEFYNRGIDIEQHGDTEYADKAMAARDAAWIAFREAVSGNCKDVKEDLAKSFAIVGGKPGAGVKWLSAVPLAFCGETRQAQHLVDEVAVSTGRSLAPAVANPQQKNPVVYAIWLPVMRAAIEIGANRPDRAIEFLEPAKAYLGAGFFHQAPVLLLWPEYLRGLAYLNQKAGAEAAAEFQTILDHRGMIPMGINYPLAHLGLARAANLMGDTAKARKYYQDFFVLWKDADSDIPILIEAKNEYSRLKQ